MSDGMIIRKAPLSLQVCVPASWTDEQVAIETVMGFPGPQNVEHSDAQIAAVAATPRLSPCRWPRRGGGDATRARKLGLRPSR